jgi:hypothetical protein
MVVETHGPSAVAIWLANRDIQIGHQISSDAGNSCLLLARRVKAPFAQKLTPESAIAGDIKSASLGIIVGTRHVAD